MAQPTGLPSIEDIGATLATWGSNLSNQTHGAFARMTAKDWLRLIMVVGAYALFRPYAVKFGANFQQRQFEKAQKQELEEAAARKAARAGMSANDLRSPRYRNVDVPGAESSDDGSDVDEHRASEWGRKARVRQRKILRKVVEAHERKLAQTGNESDKDIEDLLED